jgi:YidC/Oxa1 family membrane protein insertase
MGNIWEVGIIQPFTNVLLYIYTLAGHNFGIAIILFTILIRLLTYPLTMQQMKGMQKMQELQKDKRYTDMQAKFKGDKERLAQEQMKLYKEMKISPFSSCLPTLIQFPIIIGLYQSLVLALANTPYEMVNLTRIIYPWLLKVSDLIPLKSHFLWMELGQPERLTLSFLPFGIPILAIVVVVTTYMQSKLMTPPPSSPGDQSAMFGNMMNIYMPFLMGYIALTLASGLALYFVASNVIGIAQYAAMGKLNWNNLLPKFMQKQQSGGSEKSLQRKNEPTTPSSEQSSSQPGPKGEQKGTSGSSNPVTKQYAKRKPTSGSSKSTGGTNKTSGK